MREIFTFAVAVFGVQRLVCALVTKVSLIKMGAMKLGRTVQVCICGMKTIEQKSL